MLDSHDNTLLARRHDERQAEDLGADLEQIDGLIKLTEGLIFHAEWRTPVQADSRGQVNDFAGLLRDALGDTLKPHREELAEQIGKLTGDDGRPA